MTHHNTIFKGPVAGGNKYIEFTSKQQYRTTHDPVGYKKLETYQVNFGPQHPAAHGVLRLILGMTHRYDLYHISHLIKKCMVKT